jgi:hypothetical protein
MSGARSVLAGLVAGLLVGLLIAGVVVATGWLDRPTPQHGDDAIAAFLQAWADNRNGTFITESTYVRTTDDDRELRSTVRVAQRPPSRLLVQFDSVEARVDGRPLRCTEDPAGRTLCGPEGPEGAPYEEVVDAELETLLGYLVGDPPLYEVEGDGDGCFDLTLARDLPYAPYGEAARFCFDEETGAMVLARIERPEATDVTEAVSVQSEVTDADLRPPTG